MDINFELQDPCLVAALEEIARRKWIREAIESQKRQYAAARNGALDARAVDGMGEVVRRVDSFAYHDWANKLGSYACWEDPGFQKYFDRIAPEAKVKCKGTKVQVGYTRPSLEDCRDEPAKRFSKTYNFDPKPDL